LKKALSILIISVLLFNLAGYQLVFYFAGEQADKVLQTQLDNEAYNENELVVMKMPMSVPYYSGTNGFEYTRGEVAVNGIIYRYVKKRVVNDTIEMYCIPHENKMEILNARDMFAKLAADFTNASNHQQKQTQNTGFKPFFTDGYDFCKPALPLPYKTATEYDVLPVQQSTHPFILQTIKPPEYVTTG
jgi:hypothetical protein